MRKNCFDYYFKNKEIHFNDGFLEDILNDFIPQEKKEAEELTLFQSLQLAIIASLEPNIGGRLLNDVRLKLSNVLYQNALTFGLYIIEHELQKDTFISLSDFASNLYSYGVDFLMMEKNATIRKVALNDKKSIRTIESQVKYNDSSKTRAIKKHNFIKNDAYSNTEYVDIRNYDSLTGENLFIQLSNKKYYIKAFNSTFLYQYILKYSNKDFLGKIAQNRNNRYINDDNHLNTIPNAYNKVVDKVNELEYQHFTKSDKILFLTGLNNAMSFIEINDFHKYIKTMIDCNYIYNDNLPFTRDTHYYQTFLHIFKLSHKVSIPIALVCEIMFLTISTDSILKFLMVLSNDLENLYSYILNNIYEQFEGSIEELKEFIINELNHYYLLDKFENELKNKLPHLKDNEYYFFINDFLAYTTRLENIYFKNVNSEKVIDYNKKNKNDYNTLQNVKKIFHRSITLKESKEEIEKDDLFLYSQYKFS